MADWGSGYIVDTAYVHDFCRVQVPAMLSFAALAKGVAAPGGRGEALSYCDLGCGQGLTATIVAAANPNTKVFAADFNPTHIAGARSLADAAGLDNIVFREADFAELADDASVPEFDIIALHGVYSWIGADHRRAIVALIRRRLKPGGLVYVSYDAMPGWAGMAPLRRLMVQLQGAQPQVSSKRALDQALALADRLKEAGAHFYRMYPQAAVQLERLRKLPASYLAHELLTRDWQAFTFADLAQELAAAKLTYLGSAHLTDHVDRVNFTDAQQALLADLADPLINETTRDMIIGRQFRRDIFAKGFAPMTPMAARDRWLASRFVLTSPRDDIELAFDAPLGRFQLRSELYQPVIDAFAAAPLTLREVVERLPETTLGWASLTDAIKVLVGQGHLAPALPLEDEAVRQRSTQAFNAAVTARAKETTELRYLASPVTGGGIRVDPLTQLYMQARRKGIADPAALLASLAALGGGSFEKDGRKLSADEVRAQIATKIAAIDDSVVPLLGRLGIV
ncbi:class I SAM-dependent methyltransferase [Bradyrhizobium manausense]|uniref:class I SAM-dependent methyltransferase n=1 Tax=Bradyrhizobium manausense TaxID=989370 RepID=UPI001BA9713B|nr:class I SAM-dependent methyltransferase [Bradyrhizobium manausense]MBR0726724.1 class I SAM-dependent methyltransferase [Bradyrhizobium manausense]